MGQLPTHLVFGRGRLVRAKNFHFQQLAEGGKGAGQLSIGEGDFVPAAGVQVCQDGHRCGAKVQSEEATRLRTKVGQHRLALPDPDQDFYGGLARLRDAEGATGIE